MEVKIFVDMTQPQPDHLWNWANHHNLQGQQWGIVKDMFQVTTGGRMDGIKGERWFELVFDCEEDCTVYLLRWS